MYKYVQRRLKDIVERTYSVLDVKTTWTCNNKNLSDGGLHHGGCNGNSKQILIVRPIVSELPSNETQKANRGELWLIPERKNPSSSSGNSSGAHHHNKEKCHKNEKERQHYDNAWISALTWSSALVCGWYASQLLCLHRRNLGWDTRCCYSKLFMSPSRALHTNILARIAFATPTFNQSRNSSSSSDPKQQFDTPRRQFNHLKRVEVSQAPDQKSVKDDDSGVFEANSPKTKQPIFEDHEELHDLHKFVINVSNEEDDFKEVKKEKKHVFEEKTKEPTTVEQAVNELWSVLGEIEFQLGVKSINVGDYQTAVSHLKLATSHHHAAATFNLGICFEQGLGIKQDLHLAMECYQVAADLGHPQAMYNLGIFYAQGLGGLKKNRKAAKKCFETAARLGVMEAKIALGLPITPPTPIIENMPFDYQASGAINVNNYQTAKTTAVLVS